MSGLVEKVKGVVRNKSKHRGSENMDSVRPRTASDQHVLTPETSNRRSGVHESGRGRDSGVQTHNGLEGTTRSFAAMNVSDPRAVASSTHSHAMPLPPLPSDAAQNIESPRVQTQALDCQYQKERPFDGNRTTPMTSAHQRNISGSIGGSANQETSPEIVSDGESLIKRKPLPPTKIDAIPHLRNNVAIDRDMMNHPKGLRSLPGHKPTRSTDVAPNDPSPLVPHFTKRSAAGNSGVAGERQDRDLRLPANFNLSNTERTHVETSVVPAVTQEKVHIQRTELVTKAVHRDVHIDHHYTYIQPISVLEILPARHFRLDPITGVKTEIPAPPGYKLPAHLKPCKAEDYSHLRQTMRHYVVDEDHPHGRLENPLLRHEHDVLNVQGQQKDY